VTKATTVKAVLATLVMSLAWGCSSRAGLDDVRQTKAQASIDKGVAFLLSRQGDDGSWLHDPAMTALACTALHQSRSQAHAEAVKAAVAKGRLLILQAVQQDGSFRDREGKYINYTTAVCLSALAVINHPDDQPILRRARRFILDSQLDEDNPDRPTAKGTAYYGGIGYGSAGPDRPDLSNTQLALEALALTDHLDSEAAGGKPEDAAKSKLAWENALAFLKACQNVPADAGPAWVVSDQPDPSADGGFIYKPGESKASDKLAGDDDGEKETLRSYGSMTYAGLKSMIYAKLGKDDMRVKAAAEWARRNYRLDENPGMGPEGHFYYLLTFAKAHAALGAETVKTPDGKEHNWRQDLVDVLVALQKPDGHWLNEKHGRWMEGLPELVTSYALATLEVAVGDGGK